MGFEVKSLIGPDNRIRLKVGLVNIPLKAGLLVHDALWDTGASTTAITKDLADAIGLELLAEGRTDTAGGLTRCWKTCGSIVLPDDTVLTIDNMIVLEGTGAHVIIGMDIISRHRSTIWREGNCMFLKYE